MSSLWCTICSKFGNHQTDHHDTFEVMAGEMPPGVWPGRVESRVTFHALSYEEYADRAKVDPAFRDGLLAAAAICRAQGRDPSVPPCPAGMAGIYIETIADGEIP